MSKQEIARLRQQIEALWREDPTDSLARVAPEPAKGQKTYSPRIRRVLRGHFGKVYALHWSGDSEHLVSASQDGKLIIWNAFTTNKVRAIALRSSWVMTCAFSDDGAYVACGGLDNLCTVYKMSEGEAVGLSRPHAELRQHQGYLSCCRFIGDKEIISSSGDSTCVLWDIERKEAKNTFSDHASDCMSVCVGNNGNTFISGSADATARLWDFRQNTRAVKTFHGHESDINSVDYFPDHNAFATGSDDSKCVIWDIRAYAQVNTLRSPTVISGITSVAFSGSGRMLFAGYDDCSCYMWDSQTGRMMNNLVGHENRVSCIGVPKDGRALCTGSWDTVLKVWA